MIFQTPAEISKITTMAHSSLRLQVDTQENLTPDTISKLMGLYEKLGWFSFNIQEIQPDELLNLPEIIIEKHEKSPSQRLYGRLFVYWKAKNPQADTDIFRTWYEKVLENFGQSYLDKLN